MIAVVGDLDIATCPAFSRIVDDVVAASPGQCIAVDLSRTWFVAACGVTALVRARAAASVLASSLHVVIAPTHPSRARLIRTLGDGAGFAVQPDIRAATAVPGDVLRTPSRSGAIPSDEAGR